MANNYTGRITWDATGKKTYETGVRMGVLYDLVVTNNVSKYTNGVAWNGLTAVNEQPSGAESTKLYADDVKYLDLVSAEEFGATIEAYTYPDEFSKHNGEAELTPGVIISQQDRTTFGLSYRTTIGNDVDGNSHGYKLHLIYGCKASPSEKGYSTINDSPEAITFSWTITTTPVSVSITTGSGENTTVTEYKPTAILIIDSTKVDSAKLKALEDKLYGTSETVPELPLPAEVFEILTSTT